MKKTMPYTALLLAFFLGCSASSTAQKDDPYAKILFMVIDGDYEKAIHKAEKYTTRSSTRKEPEPYFLMSMAYYEISKNESMREDYPRAFRDAVKYAYKGARYDEEGIHVEKHSRYLTDLKVDLMRESRFYYDEGSWRKSLLNAKYVTRIDNDDLAALLLKASAETRSRNEYQAKQTFEEALNAATSFSETELNSELKPFLRFAIMEYASILKENGAQSEADPLLAVGDKVFSDDREFQNFLEGY